MEFYRKALLILLFTLISCSIHNLSKDKEIFDIKINQLEIWFDAMPKINHPSLLHFIVDFNLKNLSNKSIKLDSLNFELYMQGKLFLRFYDKGNIDKMILPEKEENFSFKYTSKDVKNFKDLNSKKSKIYMNLFFNSGDNSFIKKIYIGESEIQMVY